MGAALRMLKVIAALALGVLPAAAQGDARSYDCIIQPSVITKIGPPATGIIAEVNVDRGDWVEAGQQIARLDTVLQDLAVRNAELRAQSRAELEAAEARVVFLRARLERNSTLVTQNVVTVASVEEIQTELAVAENDLLSAQQAIEIAELELEIAQADRARRVVISPIAGYVTERTLSAGEYWGEDKSIVTIAGVDQLYVEAIADLAAFALAQVGASAMVKPEEPIGGQYDARIAVVDQVFDAASGTFGVRLVLDNSERLLPAGLRCTVTFAGP